MISVIIPLYNKRLTVCKTVETVLGQTYKDFELIIVDDGSTDGSLDLIRSRFDDDRIRCISKPNSGVSATRNLGVKEATGSWVAFIDADDLWMPTYLEEMAGVIERNPHANMVGCASYVAYFDSSKIITDRMIDKYYGQECHINFFMGMDSISHIGGTCIKKDAFEKVGGFDINLKNNEDILLMAKLALENHYVYLGKMLHVYMLDIPGQVTRDVSKKNKHMKNVLSVINEIYAYSKNYDNRLVNSALRFRFYDYLLRFLKTKDSKMLGYFIDNIDSRLIRVECIKWMKKPAFVFFACLCIYAVKLQWRLHGFQSRSHKSKYSNILQKQYWDYIKSLKGHSDFQ